MCPEPVEGHPARALSLSKGTRRFDKLSMYHGFSQVTLSVGAYRQKKFSLRTIEPSL